MSTTTARAPRLSAVLRQAERVTPLELFFDLVFVLAITQCTALIAALCVPEAFDESALFFACAYGVVRAAHIALFLIASREDPALRRSVNGLAGSTAVGVGLLFVASAADGATQAGIW